MLADPQDTVDEVFPSLLERFALMFCEAVEREVVRVPPGPALGARSFFDGSLRGTFEIAMPAGLAAEVAANVLGADLPDAAGLESREAVRELASVLGGHLATLLAPGGAGCRPSVPEVRPLDGVDWLALLRAPGSRAFLVDERPVIVRLAVDRRDQ